MAEDTKKYRLRAGFSHIAEGNSLAEGSEVELTDSQYLAFQDRFEPTVATGEGNQMPVSAAAQVPQWDNVLGNTEKDIAKYFDETDLTAAQIRELIASEEAGKNRKGVLSLALQKMSSLAAG